jgi:hypothetical protein
MYVHGFGLVKSSTHNLKINHLNDTPSTKAARGGIFSGVFNKDVKVPLQEAELVGTSSSNSRALKHFWKYIARSLKPVDWNNPNLIPVFLLETR